METLKEEKNKFKLNYSKLLMIGYIIVISGLVLTNIKSLSAVCGPLVLFGFIIVIISSIKRIYETIDGRGRVITAMSSGLFFLILLGISALVFFL